MAFDLVVGIGGNGILVVGGLVENVELWRDDNVELSVIISLSSCSFENGSVRGFWRL